MSNTIHGMSHKALKHMRKYPAALSVYWIYISRTNNENIAWPSLRGLESDTGWNRNTCKLSRDWLVEHKALERVPDYQRPEWKELDEKERKKRTNLDKTEYYRPTGYIEIDGERFEMLYFGKSEPSDIDNGRDVTRRQTSQVTMSHATRHRAPLDIERREPELSTSSSNLDSSKNEPARKQPAILTPIVIARVASTSYWKAFIAAFDDNPPILTSHYAELYERTTLIALRDMNATEEEITAVTREKRSKPRKMAYRFDFLPTDIQQYREEKRSQSLISAQTPAIWRPLPDPPARPTNLPTLEERTAQLADFDENLKRARKEAHEARKKASGE